MVATRRLLMAGALLLLMAGCSRSTAVRMEDVVVTPVTAAGVQRVVRESGSKAILVNVWATWCGPCREEFPDLVSVAHKYQGRGLKVVLVSADADTDMAAVKQFLAEHGVDFPVYLKSEKDQPFIDALDKRWSGALPATFLYDGSGNVRDFWEGKASLSVLEEKVVKVLSGQTQPTGGSS